MTDKPINLRRERKRRARREKAEQGDANAAQHGLAKPIRDLARARAEKDRRDHDGKRRE